MVRPVRFAFVAAAALVLWGCQATNVQDDPSAPVGAPSPESDSQLAQLQTQLGIGYMRERKFELAWKRLHRAIEADPGYSPAHNAMALLYEQLGEVDKAETHFLTAIELNPTDSSSQTNFGSFLCRSGKYEEGEARFLQALKNSLYTSPQVAYANAGLCMKGAGDLAKAEKYFRSALQLSPRMPSVLLNMAEISYAQERFLPARAYLQRYLAVAAHTPRTLWLGIRVERELGDRNTVSSYALLLKSNYPDAHETQLLLESEKL